MEKLRPRAPDESEKDHSSIDLEPRRRITTSPLIHAGVERILTAYPLLKSHAGLIMTMSLPKTGWLDLRRCSSFPEVISDWESKGVHFFQLRCTDESIAATLYTRPHFDQHLFAAMLASALADLHAQDIAICNLELENIAITDGGRLVFLDWTSSSVFSPSRQGHQHPKEEEEDPDPASKIWECDPVLQDIRRFGLVMFRAITNLSLLTSFESLGEFEKGALSAQMPNGLLADIVGRCLRAESAADITMEQVVHLLSPKAPAPASRRPAKSPLFKASKKQLFAQKSQSLGCFLL